MSTLFLSSQILSCPKEAAWLAPELIRFFVRMAQEIGVVIEQYEALPLYSRAGECFAGLASKFRWSSTFVQRTDAWSTGTFLEGSAQGTAPSTRQKKSPTALHRLACVPLFCPRRHFVLHCQRRAPPVRRRPRLNNNSERPGRQESQSRKGTWCRCGTTSSAKHCSTANACRSSYDRVIDTE